MRSIVTVIIVAAFLVTGAVVLAGGSYTSKYITTDGGLGMCLAKKHGNWNNGNPIHLWRCDGSAANLKWNYEAHTFLIRAKSNPNKCLAKKHSNTNTGNPIHLWDCSGSSANLRWSYNSSTGRISSLQNPNMCIAKKYAHAAMGNPIQLAPCNGPNKNLAWRFVSNPSDSGDVVPKTTGSTFYLQCPTEKMDAVITSLPKGWNANPSGLNPRPDKTTTTYWPGVDKWDVSCAYGNNPGFTIHRQYYAKKCEVLSDGRVKCSG